jgi:hypothetical protein
MNKYLLDMSKINPQRVTTSGKPLPQVEAYVVQGIQREWEDCRACEGTGGYMQGNDWILCPVCGGDEGHFVNPA